MARPIPAATRVVVWMRAYHGNTNALVEISPCKFNGRGGAASRRTCTLRPCRMCICGAHRGADAGSDMRIGCR